MASRTVKNQSDGDNHHRIARAIFAAAESISSSKVDVDPRSFCKTEGALVIGASSPDSAAEASRNPPATVPPTSMPPRMNVQQAITPKNLHTDWLLWRPTIFTPWSLGSTTNSDRPPGHQIGNATL